MKNTGFILSIAIWFVFFISCYEKSYVVYRPHYISSNNEEKYYGSSDLSETEKSGIIHVFNYYGVDYKISDNRKVLIPKKLADNWELVWNYTTKSTDLEWLKDHTIN